MRILVLEDDPRVASFLRRGLEADCHVVDVASTRADAFRRATNGTFDVLIFDLGLFGADGHDVLQRLRREGNAAGVIVLARKGTQDDRIRALEEGADDCLLKPFSFAELAARVRALQRRLTRSFELVLRAGDVHFDLARHRATVGGRPIELTPREYQLLEYFIRNPGGVLSRAILADRVWGLDFDTGTNCISVYVSYLRRKLAEVGSQCTIETVRGVGYAFKPGASQPGQGDGRGP